jgi:hypothetical protein
MALAGQSRRCEHGDSDRCGRQKDRLSHSFLRRYSGADDVRLRSGDEGGLWPFEENRPSRCFNAARGRRVIRSQVTEVRHSGARRRREPGISINYTAWRP